MIQKIKVNCDSCHATFTVKYGRKTKTISYEVYSCKQCKNLFSLTNQEPYKCPVCEENDLIRYNMNRDDNIAYYDKMLDEELLTDEKHQMLVQYWEKMKSFLCPVCGNKTLHWSIQS